MKDEAKETCIFLTPGKINKCTVLTTPCSDEKTRQECSFHKTERQFYEERNKAIALNRKKENCSKCKYKAQHCEPIKLGDDYSGSCEYEKVAQESFLCQ